jgi:hypothetical protein
LERHSIVVHHLREYLVCGMRVEFLGCTSEAQRCVSPASGLAGKLRGFGSDGRHLGQNAVAVKDDVTSRGQGGATPLGYGTRKGIHRYVVAH